MRFAPLLLLLLVATSAAAPQLLGIKATNTTVKAFFSEVATGNATWVIKDGNNSIVDAGTSVYSAAVTDSITYPTAVTAPGSYTLTYNATFLVGNQTSSAAQSVLFSVATPPPPPAASLVGTLNFLQPPPGIAIQGNQIVSGTATSPAGVKEVWFVASPTPPPNDDCSKVSGWIRASGTTSWAGVWSFADLGNLPGTYYLTGKIVDTAGAITACNYVQIIYKLNTSLTGTPTPTATPAFKTKSLTCAGKKCDCPERRREFIWIIEGGNANLKVEVNGKECKSISGSDTLIGTCTEDGRYELLINEKVEKSCSSSVASGGLDAASEIPDEIKNRRCTPENVQFGGFASGSTYYNPTKITLGDRIRCIFGGNVYFAIIPKGTGHDGEEAWVSETQATSKNKSWEFTPRYEGIYTLAAKLHPSDKWIDIGYYKVEAAFAVSDVAQGIFLLFVIGASLSYYVTRPEFGYYQVDASTSAPPVHKLLRNCYRKWDERGRSTQKPFTGLVKKKWFGLLGKVEYVFLYTIYISTPPSKGRWSLKDYYNAAHPAGKNGFLRIPREENGYFAGAFNKMVTVKFIGIDENELRSLYRDFKALNVRAAGPTYEEKVLEDQRAEKREKEAAITPDAIEKLQKQFDAISAGKEAER